MSHLHNATDGLGRGSYSKAGDSAVQTAAVVSLGVIGATPVIRHSLYLPTHFPPFYFDV
jgi:hypothetical protein